MQWDRVWVQKIEVLMQQMRFWKDEELFDINSVGFAIYFA